MYKHDEWRILQETFTVSTFQLCITELKPSISFSRSLINLNALEIHSAIVCFATLIVVIDHLDALYHIVWWKRVNVFIRFSEFSLFCFLPLIITYVHAGTFAVVCMMASKSVLTYSVSEPPVSMSQFVNLTELNSTDLVVVPASKNSTDYTPVQVATAVCFVVGLWQVSS